MGVLHYMNPLNSVEIVSRISKVYDKHYQQRYSTKDDQNQQQSLDHLHSHSRNTKKKKKNLSSA